MIVHVVNSNLPTLRVHNEGRICIKCTIMTPIVDCLLVTDCLVVKSCNIQNQLSNNDKSWILQEIFRVAKISRFSNSRKQGKSQTHTKIKPRYTETPFIPFVFVWL